MLSRLEIGQMYEIIIQKKRSIGTDRHLLKRLLQRSNPFKSKMCEKADCMVCLNRGKGPCDVLGITYSMTCMECASSNEKEKSETRTLKLCMFLNDK